LVGLQEFFSESILLVTNLPTFFSAPADENGEMEKKAMMDYVMNSSFWPSLCHEDKVLVLYSPL
jgi:hypothetical protein